MAALLRGGVLVPLLVGAALGALGGELRYGAIDTSEGLCVSCHHGTAQPSSLEGAPHSEDFYASCHVCHVLPVKEYLSYGSARLVATVPGWISELHNPVVADQSCMECHLARGRGVIDCERCHPDGGEEVDLTERCEVCHEDRPIMPLFVGVHCRDCHVEAFLGQAERREGARSDRLSGHSAEDHEKQGAAP